MDAATPFRRIRLRAAGLLILAAAGCHTTDTKPATPAAGRGQVPGEPITAVSPDPIPGSPVTPAVVVGRPVPAGQPTPPGPIVPARYNLNQEAKSSPRHVLPEGDPRIKVVAQVGAGGIITDQEVWEAVHMRIRDYLKESADGRGLVRDPEREKQVYDEELRRLMERELILDDMYNRLKATPKGGQTIEIIKEDTTKMVDRQLRDRRTRQGCKTEEEFREALATQGLTLPVFRRHMERNMMAEQYIYTMLKEKGTTVGLTEIREYFDLHPDEFRTTDRVKWLDIFVSVNRFASARAAYDYAAAVREKALAGADFAALSGQYDHGFAGAQPAPRTGVGLGQKRGEIEPREVEPTVWALQPGQVSELIQTAAGYHIVKVAEREVSSIRPFDDKIQTEIRHKLTEKLFEREHRRIVERIWWHGVFDVTGKPGTAGPDPSPVQNQKAVGR